jgi:hypothetical protein
MAVTMKHMALAITALGVISFLLGVVAENKKVLYQILYYYVFVMCNFLIKFGWVLLFFLEIIL